MDPQERYVEPTLTELGEVGDATLGVFIPGSNDPITAYREVSDI